MTDTDGYAWEVEKLDRRSLSPTNRLTKDETHKLDAKYTIVEQNSHDLAEFIDGTLTEFPFIETPYDRVRIQHPTRTPDSLSTQ